MVDEKMAVIASKKFRGETNDFILKASDEMSDCVKLKRMYTVKPPSQTSLRRNAFSSICSNSPKTHALHPCER